MKTGVFRRYHVGNNPVNRKDPLGLASLTTAMSDGTTTFDPRPEDLDGVPFTIPTSNDVVPTALPGANAPFTTPDINPIGVMDPAYGPYGTYIDTGDPRGRDIHGGGSGLQSPYSPRQGSCPTQGCTRGQNENLQELSGLIRDFKLRHPGVRIPYIRRW